MIWRTIVLSRADLAAGLRRIRAAGGTPTTCVPKADGYELTCTFPVGDAA